MVINGVTVAHYYSYVIKSTTHHVLTMIPDSISPVLKQNVVFTLENTFPYTLTREDFTINITSVENGGIKYLRVVEVDDAAKTVTAKYGGAWSGNYKAQMRHASFGLIDVSSHTLVVESEYSAISPLTGSVFGGTLLTITGTNSGRLQSSRQLSL